jgi:hypothetical protein
MNRIAPYAKALIGALVAGLSSLYQALDGDPALVTSQEWVAVVMATLAGLAAVFAIPNRDPEGEHQDESTQPPDGRGILGKA